MYINIGRCLDDSRMSAECFHPLLKIVEKVKDGDKLLELYKPNVANMAMAASMIKDAEKKKQFEATVRLSFAGVLDRVAFQPKGICAIIDKARSNISEEAKRVEFDNEIYNCVKGKLATSSYCLSDVFGLVQEHCPVHNANVFVKRVFETARKQIGLDCLSKPETSMDDAAAAVIDAYSKAFPDGEIDKLKTLIDAEIKEDPARVLMEANRRLTTLEAENKRLAAALETFMQEAKAKTDRDAARKAQAAARKQAREAEIVKESDDSDDAPIKKRKSNGGMGPPPAKKLKNDQAKKTKPPADGEDDTQAIDWVPVYSKK